MNEEKENVFTRHADLSQEEKLAKIKGATNEEKKEQSISYQLGLLIGAIFKMFFLLTKKLLIHFIVVMITWLAYNNGPVEVTPFLAEITLLQACCFWWLFMVLLKLVKE